MFHAARKAGTFLGEAFMYRLHPQTAKLVELVKSGAIGEVRMIKSSFGFAMPGFMPEHRLYANDLAGGGILDVGGYPVSMARLIAGAAAGKPFADPDKVVGRGASRPVRRRRMGIGACCIFPAASSPRFPAASRSTRTMCCASSARRAASRCRTSGSPAATATAAPARSTSSIRTASARPSSVNEDAPPLFLRGRWRRRSHPCRPAGIRLAGHELGRQARQSARARQMARGGRARIRDREGRRSASTRSPAASSAPAAAPSPSAQFPGLAAAGVVPGARLRGFPHLLLGLDPARCLLRGGRQSVRHRLCLRRAAIPRRCSASG